MQPSQQKAVVKETANKFVLVLCVLSAALAATAHKHVKTTHFALSRARAGTANKHAQKVLAAPSPVLAVIVCKQKIELKNSFLPAPVVIVKSSHFSNAIYSSMYLYAKRSIP